MLKIFSAMQIREADAATISKEPVKSIDLMERAATACFHALQERYSTHTAFRVFCGPGNNGGDGLVIARMLFRSGYEVTAYGVGDEGTVSEDRNENLKRLQKMSGTKYIAVSSVNDVPKKGKNEVWVDALFGTGLTRPLTGIYSELIRRFRESGAEVVSVDLPSGLYADRLPEKDQPVVKAKRTFTFQFPKISFYFSASGKYAGKWKVLDIGLLPDFISEEPTLNFQLESSDILKLFRKRKKFSNKGTYGHGLLIAGSTGKSGAALLSARAALRSGTGLLTVHVPSDSYQVLQSGAPEAMVIRDRNSGLVSDCDHSFLPYTAAGIGPGIGIQDEPGLVLRHLLEHFGKPMVLDADALNILALHPEWMVHVPNGTILTPHPKEFDRLTGDSQDELERHHKQIELSRKYKLVIVLKGTYTCISMPDGRCFFNVTGNAGLARGGSGDILTGMVLSFLAQGYEPEEAAMLAVYFHGAAADRVASKHSMQGMLPSDVVEELKDVFKEYE